MPRNRLALAIRVGRKPELVSALERGNDRPHVLFVAVDDLVLHLEAIGNVDRTVLGHQITHVTVAGEDLEIFAEIFLDRLGLGGRLDDDQVFAHSPLRSWTQPTAAVGRLLRSAERRVGTECVSQYRTRWSPKI